MKSIIARALLLAALAVTIGVAVSPTGFLADIVSLHRRRAGGEEIRSDIMRIDRFSRDVEATGADTFFVRLDNFANSPFSAELWYFRLNYKLYPRSLVVARPGEIIFNGRDLVAKNFEPDTAWLRENGIHHVLRLRLNETGPITGSIERPL